MKIGVLIFVLVSFTVAKAMYLDSTAGASLDFPELEIPDRDFEDLSGGCGGFTDCIEYVGAVIKNIGVGIIVFVELVFNLVVYAFALFSLMVVLSVSGIDGAPWYVNAILTTPFVAALSIIIYKMIRSGQSES